MDSRKANEYLDMLEEFTESKQTKTFKRAFGTINNKLVALRKRHPDSLEYDFLRDAMRDIRQFWDYTFDTIFNAISYANEVELRLSHIVGENEKYAKILSALGVTPMLYFCINGKTLDFIIDNYSEIGILTIEQLVDIDIAYMICELAFNKPPKNYAYLKKTYNFIKKQALTDENTPKYKRMFRKKTSGFNKYSRKRRRKRD